MEVIRGAACSQFLGVGPGLDPPIFQFARSPGVGSSGRPDAQLPSEADTHLAHRETTT